MGVVSFRGRSLFLALACFRLGMFDFTSLSLSLAWEGDLGVGRGWRCGSGISTVVASFLLPG